MRTIILLMLTITAGFAASQFLKNNNSMTHQEIVESEVFQSKLQELARFHAERDIQNKSVPLETLQALHLMPNTKNIEFACVQPNVVWNYNDYYHAEILKLFPKSDYSKELKRKFFTSLKPLRKLHKPYAL